MTWIEQAAETLRGGTHELEFCETHESHDTVTASVSVGTAEGESIDMVVFDGYKYQGTHGFCTGDDDVSRTLINQGYWEKATTQAFRDCLRRSQGIVIDVGCHVGWYTLLATHYMRPTLAIGANPEQVKVLWQNSQQLLVIPDLYTATTWIDETTPQVSADECPPIAVVKIDIEGSEQHAINALWPVIEAGKVANIIMEVSPVFNDSYPELVLKIIRAGYDVEMVDIDGVPYVPRYQEPMSLNFDQADMLFTRQR